MNVSKRFICFLLFVFHFCYAADENDNAPHSRKARHLVYPPSGSKIQLISGFGIPIQLPFQAITLGYVFKADFWVPYNGTMYTKPFDAFAETTAKRSLSTGEDRQRRDSDTSLPTDRWDIYAILETFVHQSLSVGKALGSITKDAGRQCMLRAICESAVSGVQHDGLLGELLHIILTPSTTSEPMTSKHHVDYHVAERIGRSAESFSTCGTLFSACHMGALDMITKLVSAF